MTFYCQSCSKHIPLTQQAPLKSRPICLVCLTRIQEAQSKKDQRHKKSKATLTTPKLLARYVRALEARI